MNVVALVAGLALVAISAADALNTLVSTRLRVGRLWPSDLFYALSWRALRRMGGLIGREDRREAFHSFFGPLSLLGLLVMWVIGQVIGWALVWWALQSQFEGVSSFADALYYSGIAYFTIGFGDVLPVGTTPRLLTLLEAFVGLGTTALVIGYLPVLYGAYSSREAQLLSLDDFTGDRITPVSLLEAHGPGGNLDDLDDYFSRWEQWCAEILESHTSYPMLMLFRSQHPGQSWVTALGVVTDAANLVLASVDSDRKRNALLLYRRATRTLTLLAQAFRLSPDESVELREDYYRIAYARMEAAGFPMRPFDDAWVDLVELRGAYGPWLEALIVHLVAPRGFWGHAIDVPQVEATRPPAERIWGDAGPPVAGGPS